VSVSASAAAAARGEGDGEGSRGDEREEVRAIHWFPYERVRVVNADP